MYRTASPSNASPDPRLCRALWQWLWLGLLLVLCVPAARGSSAIGALPFWLLIAPLSALLVAYRNVLAAAVRRLLVPPPRRRQA